jgi:hypothetical protein
MAADISILEEMASQGLLDPEQVNALRAKKQQAATQQAISGGTPWWEAKGRETTWYSGNRPETSNNDWLAQNGGPVSEGDYARSRGQADTTGRGGLGAADFAAWQESQKPISRDMGTINNLGDMSSVHREMYDRNQRNIAGNNRANAAAAEKKKADEYAATPEGKVNAAKLIMRRLGLNPQQAIAIATAQGNPNLDPAGLQAAAVLPQFAAGANRNNAMVNAQQVQAQGNEAVQNARNQGAKDIAGMQIQAGDAQANRQLQGAIAQAMIARGLVPNNLMQGGGQQPGNPFSLKVPQLQDAPIQGPQAGNSPWWNQQGNAQSPVPGFTQLPMSPEQQAAADRAKQQNELAGLQIQNERNKQNPTFPIDQQAAQRAAELKARLNDPAFVFSESNADPIRFAVKNWYERGEPLPIAIESGLRSLYNRDTYDSDNKHLGNLFGLIGAGGYGEGNDAQVFADYLESHYGVPQQVGIKLYHEKIKNQGA